MLGAAISGWRRVSAILKVSRGNPKVDSPAYPSGGSAETRVERGRDDRTAAQYPVSNRDFGHGLVYPLNFHRFPQAARAMKPGPGGGDQSGAGTRAKFWRRSSRSTPA